MGSFQNLVVVVVKPSVSISPFNCTSSLLSCHSPMRWKFSEKMRVLCTHLQLSKANTKGETIERGDISNLSLPFFQNELDGNSHNMGLRRTMRWTVRQMDGITFSPHFLTGMTCFWGPLEGQIIAWEFCDQNAKISKFVENLWNSKDDESFIASLFQFTSWT